MVIYREYQYRVDVHGYKVIEAVMPFIDLLTYFSNLSFHHPLWRLQAWCLAVDVPSSDSVTQDALNGEAVELFEDLRAPFQPPEGEEVLSCPLHNFVVVSVNPLVMWTLRNLKLSTRSTTTLSMWIR